MAEGSSSSQVLRFGVFEVDLRAGELRRKGIRIKLQEQPFQILVRLLARPGEVVTREELQQQLWPEGTFVDFEHALNVAVNRLRDALDDSPDSPRFVETLPRRGYRFIAPVEGAPPPSAEQRKTVPRTGRWLVLMAAVLVVALLAVLLGFDVGGLRRRLWGGVAPGEITSLAVLPLENLSGDPEQAYFVEGMTEALITNLGKIKTLRVISRQSVMRYKNTEKPLPEIGRELGVDAIIEGSVLRVGDRVRITVQLIQAKTDRHLWAESYERDLRDVLALQSGVARAIAAEVRATLTPEDETRLASTRSVNPEAYEAYLKGRYYYAQASPELTAKALQQFQQAIAKDPGYAAAYAGLADCYTLDAGQLLGLQPKEAYSRAREAAAKALQIDNTLPEAHTAMAQVMFDHDWDFVGALGHLQRAVDLNPGDVLAHSLYGYYLVWVGNREEGVAQLRVARGLDPFSVLTMRFVAHGLFFARRYEEALEETDGILAVDPADMRAFYITGRIYLEQGKYKEAIAAIEKGNALQGGGPVSVLAYAHAVAGNRREAMKILSQLQGLAARGLIPRFALAGVYVGLGEDDKALDLLQTAYEEHSPFMTMIKAEPMFDPLRSDRRFQDLLRRMNFPE